MEPFIFALRILFAIILYFFLSQVVRAIYADLRATRPASVPGARAIAAVGNPPRMPARLGRLVFFPEALAGGAGQSAPVEYNLGPANVLGRAAPSTIIVPDVTVSTEHARLEWRDGSWWIEDLGSRNGVQVNGQRVVNRLPVSFGDRIQLGQANLQLLAP